MDALTLRRLTQAWMRRKRWESEVNARAVVAELARAMNGKEAGARPQKAAQRVSPDQLMQMMGVTI